MFNGTEAPERKATGNINAADNCPICRKKALVNAGLLGGRTGTGKNMYESSVPIAASSKRIGTAGRGDAKRRGIMLKLIPPRPIPASTTASMTAKEVAVDVTYKRTKRSRIP